MSFIEFSGVSKSFHRRSGRMLLRGHIAALLRREGPGPFRALKNVSFRINGGENVAIVGANGAGKSTLLSLAVGLATPDDGVVRVSGRIAALLELGSGFHPDLTGRENVYLNASLLGLGKKRTVQVFDRIVEFSEIGDFIDQPLRTYSNGMRLRLAFSIAAHSDPDFLIVDEVLAVGDEGFQEKCFERIRQLKAQGMSLLCVAHSKTLVQQLCGRAIWLDHGELIADGSTETVLKMYEGRSIAPPPVSP